MSYVSHTSPLVAQLLELLGLKDRPIKSFAFRCESRGAMTVEFEEYATDDKTKAVLRELVRQGPLMLMPMGVPLSAAAAPNPLRGQIEDYMDKQIERLMLDRGIPAEYSPRISLRRHPTIDRLKDDLVKSPNGLALWRSALLQGLIAEFGHGSMPFDEWVVYAIKTLTEDNDKLAGQMLALMNGESASVITPKSFSDVMRRSQSEYRERLTDGKSAKLRGDCEMGVDPGEEKKGEAGLGEPAEYLPTAIRKACEAARNRVMAATNPVPMRVDPVIAEVLRQPGGQVPALPGAQTVTMSWLEIDGRVEIADPTADDG